MYHFGDIIMYHFGDITMYHFGDIIWCTDELDMCQ
jgi:hypothetical protein